MAGQGEPTLLAVMDGIAGGENIEFDVPRLDIPTRAAELE